MRSPLSMRLLCTRTDTPPHMSMHKPLITDQVDIIDLIRPKGLPLDFSQGEGATSAPLPAAAAEEVGEYLPVLHEPLSPTLFPYQHISLGCF